MSAAHSRKHQFAITINRLAAGIIAVLAGTAFGFIAAAEVQVDSTFPGGNIIVEKVEGETVTLHQDLRDTEGWWFYWCFRVRGAAGRTLQFKFTNRAPIGTRGPAVSFDEGATWRWLGTQPDNAAFSFTFPKDAESVRFSFGMTYTEASLETFLKGIGANPALKLETLCQSRKGRTVEQLRVGHVKGNPRFRVLVSCRAHCCEMMTSYTLEGLIEAMLANDADGKWFRQNVEMLAIPFVDKDGVEEGDQGKNRRPRDHNRDYGANSIYPETRALQERVTRWSDGKLRMCFDLHCPAIRGDMNEVIYMVGTENQKNWNEQTKLGKILEKIRTGPLVYHVADNLAFGKKWNTADNFKAGTSASHWATTLPGVRVATTIEIPYANVDDGEVNAQTARAFGRDLARAIRGYLESE